MRKGLSSVSAKYSVLVFLSVMFLLSVIHRKNKNCCRIRNFMNTIVYGAVIHIYLYTYTIHIQDDVNTCMHFFILNSL